MVRYLPEVLAEIARRCESAHSGEACGFVAQRGGSQEVIEVRNVAGEGRDRSEQPLPRDARENFVMDPDELLAVFERLARDKAEVVALWHSHPDAPALFSRKDREEALLDGEPALPGAEYLVASVSSGRTTDLRRYVFEGSVFVEAPL